MRLDLYSPGSYDPGAGLTTQLLWFYLGDFLVQTHLIPVSGFKVWVLRRFGAEIGQNVVIKPGVKIKFPWRLKVGDQVWLGERCWIDNLAPVTIESQVCVSQNVYLCTGNHDWSQPSFNLRLGEIYLETGCWLAANSTVGPGVRIGCGAVLTLGSAALKSLEPMGIYSGNPCQKVKTRQIGAQP
ncbi:MAG: WcaF family extracellular polysaccharide biosynthesis acetyltransferase [Cyanobacteriota bacterium]|nr:WcaF family extracellular polysaccharide biosynthesis acetyltransferase [Cyanobacteriota bacterium]